MKIILQMYDGDDCLTLRIHENHLHLHSEMAKSWMLCSLKFISIKNKIQNKGKNKILLFTFFYLLLLFFLLYNIVLVLPYINMNPPWSSCLSIYCHFPSFWGNSQNFLQYSSAGCDLSPQFFSLTILSHI